MPFLSKPTRQVSLKHRQFKKRRRRPIVMPPVIVQQVIAPVQTIELTFKLGGTNIIEIAVSGDVTGEGIDLLIRMLELSKDSLLKDMAEFEKGAPPAKSS